MLNASVDMLNHLGHKQHADLIMNAMLKTVAEDHLLTPGDFLIILVFHVIVVNCNFLFRLRRHRKKYRSGSENYRPHSAS